MAQERAPNVQIFRRRFRRVRSSARIRLPAPKLPYERREALLSRGELAFYRVLRRAIGERYSISIKTRLADVLKCPDELWDAPHGRKLSQKHVDFVLFDPDTASIIAAVELDDRSHQQPGRRRRDEFVNEAFRAAGTALFRIKAASRYDVNSLRAMLCSLTSSPMGRAAERTEALLSKQLAKR
jgi:hypothetical protein